MTQKGRKNGHSIGARALIATVCRPFLAGALLSGCGIFDAEPLATGTVNVVTLFSDSDVEDELTGATVVVDSASTSIVSIGTLDLPVGSHFISAELEGYVADPVVVTVTEGDTIDVRVALMPVGPFGFGGQQGKINADPAVFYLTYEQVLTPDIAAAIDQALADRALTGHATVSDVIAASLGARTLKWKLSSACSGPRKVIASLDSAVSVGTWCWDSDDEEPSEKLLTSEWVPQGITSSKDASAKGDYEGLHVVLVAWYGNLLYVAATNSGFRMFDMRRIYRVHETSGSDPLGRSSPDDGKLYGADYDFVLLEVGRTIQIYDLEDCQVASGIEDDLCFSSVSLDRSSNPPALVTSEYRTGEDMRKSRVGMLIVRWNLDAGSDNLEMGAGGQIASDGVFLTPTTQVQGAFMQGEEFYLSTTQGAEGLFYYEKDGDGKDPVFTTWPDGGEDLSYWPSMDRLWSVTEQPGKRMVFWVYASEMKGH